MYETTTESSIIENNLFLNANVVALSGILYFVGESTTVYQN